MNAIPQYLNTLNPRAMVLSLPVFPVCVPLTLHLPLTGPYR